MLKQFHDAWYAPNNAILVIVGDVDPKATLTEIKQLFGAIKAKKAAGAAAGQSAARCSADIVHGRHRPARAARR